MKQFGFTRSERLKSKKIYEDTYLFGKKIDSKRKLLRIAFQIIRDSEFEGVQISFSINRKSGNAVWRNRTKRLFREIYRLNKSILFNKIKNKNILISLIFITNKLRNNNPLRIKYQELAEEVLPMFEYIAQEIDAR